MDCSNYPSTSAVCGIVGRTSLSAASRTLNPRRLQRFSSPLLNSLDFAMVPKIDDPWSRDHPLRRLPGAIASHVGTAVHQIVGDVRAIFRGDAVRPTPLDPSILQPQLLSPAALSVLNGPPVTRSEIDTITKNLEKATARVEAVLALQQSDGFEAYPKEVEKMVELVEAYARDMKYSLDIGVLTRKISQESATELKRRIDALVAPMRDSRFWSMNMSVPLLRALAGAPISVGSLFTQVAGFIGFVDGVVAVKDIMFPKKINGPGLFRDISKEAKAVLHDEYLTGLDVILRTAPLEKLLVTTSCKLVNQDVISRVMVKLNHMNFSVDTNALINSNVVTKVRVDDMNGSGLRGTLSLPLPWRNTSKFEIEGIYPFAGLTCSTGLYGQPLVDFSGLWGNKLAAAGIHVELDTATSLLTKAVLGLKVRPNDHSSFGLTLNNRGLLTGTVWKEIVPTRPTFPDSMKILGKVVDPVMNYFSPAVITTQVGAMFDYCFSTKRARFMFGVKHEFDPSTTLKLRVNSMGGATALIKHKVGDKAFISLSSEVNLNNPWGPPRIGICLSLP